MDWNTQPRSVVAEAAAAGDDQAQSTLRLYEELDQLKASVVAFEASFAEYRNDMSASLDMLSADIRSLRNPKT